MTRIDWSPSVPKEVAAIVAPMLDRWRCALPTWCHDLRILFDTELEEPAETQPQMEYRFAEITIGPDWLTEDAVARENILLHEICHLLTAPLVDFVDDALEVEGDDALAAIVFRRAYEGTVQDLTRAFLDAVGPR